MIVFVTFVLFGLTVGVGTMLAPAIPSRQPRIAAGGTLALALVASGAIFLGALFGWNTLIIDYLWFALITGVFLGGTLVVGMRRTEAALIAGESVDAGWPNKYVWGVFLTWLITNLFLMTATDLQGSASIHLAQKAMFLRHNSGGFEGVEGAPAVPVLLAYFEAQLPADFVQILGGVLVILHLLLAWLLYDLGWEITNRENVGWLGFALGVAASVVWRDAVTTLMGLVFGLAFWLFSFRWAKDGLWFDGSAAAVCGAAAILAHPLTAFALCLIYLGHSILLFATPVNASHRDEQAAANRYHFWWRGLVGLPVLILIGLAPWLVLLIT